jgi:hypothetical protein|tara:strand:+ start:2601 stop:2810 length:210 start_codon:yes stop_codon:yes gene_type:complete
MIVNDLFSTFFQPQVIVVSDSQINEIKRKRLMGEKESLEKTKAKIEERIAEINASVASLDTTPQVESNS